MTALSVETIQELVKTEEGIDHLGTIFAGQEWRLIHGSFREAVERNYIPEDQRAPLAAIMLRIFREQDDLARAKLQLDGVGLRYHLWWRIYRKKIMSVMHSAPHEIVVQAEWITAWKTVWDMTEAELATARGELAQAIENYSNE